MVIFSLRLIRKGLPTPAGSGRTWPGQTESTGKKVACAVSVSGYPPMMHDPWDALTDHEAAALERAEEKYKLLGPQKSPFPDSVPICVTQIFRVNFAAFQGMDGISIHADRTRLNPLCEVGLKVWYPELEHLSALLVRAERLLRAGDTLDDELEWELQSYGVKLSADSAIAGYGENSSPLVLNRGMFYGFLRFLGDTLKAASPGSFSPALALSLTELTQDSPRL